ncbi:MAG: 50S ribosomal protein L24 [Victivallales bacterium]|nr:50S ribosomal protein L24 [Victivallales bacterium]
MAKSLIKKDAIVYVIAGADRGKSGKVLHVDRKAGRVTVEGIAIHKKTVRRSDKYPNGGIQNVESAIDISNVMAEEKYLARHKAKNQE